MKGMPSLKTSPTKYDFFPRSLRCIDVADRIASALDKMRERATFNWSIVQRNVTKTRKEFQDSRLELSSGANICMTPEFCSLHVLGRAFGPLGKISKNTAVLLQLFI